jgi:hypothetical protein
MAREAVISLKLLRILKLTDRWRRKDVATNSKPNKATKPENSPKLPANQPG